MNISIPFVLLTHSVRRTPQATTGNSSTFLSTLQLTFISQTFSKREAERINTDAAISWLSLLHGNALSSVFPFIVDIDPYDDDDDFGVSMTLVMDTLDCNPPIL